MNRNQERPVFLPVPSTTFCQNLVSAPKAITTNKDGSKCVVGGRHLLKVYSIDERKFTERGNLVVGPKKLNYSITDVQFHPVEENIIASASGNGAVILWDLNKINESKQDHLFQQHNRYVHNICFHPSDPNLLMSCSQDGNMHCFDIRRKDVYATFSGRSENIWDVQFHPLEKNIFCAVCESGNVQLWDIRKPDHYYNQFTAHSGPVFTLDWHPEDKYWLSTGGRDKTIKIWDTQLRTQPTHIIQTIAPVARIKWRPGMKYHIASCALLLDNNVTIWDIRRPFVPFAAFQEHHDVATDIVWLKDSDRILSCSKDKTLYHHVINDAERPAKHAPPVALSLSPSGIIGHAFPKKKLSSQKLSKLVGTPQTMYQGTKKSVTHTDEFKPNNSTLNFHDIRCVIEETYIEILAKQYKFYGKPFPALCDHNAQVAEKINLSGKSQTWLILKQLYLNEEKIQQDSVFPMPSPALSSQLLSNDILARKLDTPESFSENIWMNGSGSSDDNESTGIHAPSGMMSSNQYNDMALEPELDAVYDDGNAQYFTGEIGNDDGELGPLPTEAFQLRHSFGEKAVSQSDEAADQDRNSKANTGTLKPSGLYLPRWDYEDLVKQMLFYYAEQGDLQTCVTVLLSLQDAGRCMIEFSTQEEWFSGYLDILYRLHLFNIATEVINHAPPPVNSLNQNSTTIHMQCGNCNKVMSGTPPGWYCHLCRQIAQVCSVCHIPVKGLYVWCQGCGHGGHLLHLKEWFESKKYCPSGCGHKCEYS